MLEFFAISELVVQTLHAKRLGRSRPVSRVLSWMIIPLGPSSPMGSSNLPVSRAGRTYGHLFGLASSGVCRTGLLPDSWCALTAPFHPYHAPLRRKRRCGGTLSSLRTTKAPHDSGSVRRSALCCTFRRLTPPRRYLALCPMKPGLSSPLQAGQRSSSRLRRAA